MLNLVKSRLLLTKASVNKASYRLSMNSMQSLKLMRFSSQNKKKIDIANLVPNLSGSDASVESLNQNQKVKSPNLIMEQQKKKNTDS